MAAFYIRRHNELYHHGIKGQKWGIRRYQNEDGSLTPEGRKRYGIEGLDASKKDFDSRHAVKAYKKESKSLYSKIERADNRLAEDLPADRLNKDIYSANKNKQFVSDWKKEAKKVFDVQEKDPDKGWNAQQTARKNLKKKYPQFSDLIDGFSPNYVIWNRDDLNDLMSIKPNTKINEYGEIEGADVIRALLDPVYFYDFTQKDFDDLYPATNKAKSELDKYFIDKYGSEVIAKGNKQSATTEKAIKIGKALVPMLVAGGAMAFVINDAYKNSVYYKK